MIYYKCVSIYKESKMRDNFQQQFEQQQEQEWYELNQKEQQDVCI